MNENKTFLDESCMNRKIYYDVHENGLIFRPDSDEKISLNWRDIQYIEDRSGDRVDIFLYNKKEVPVRYATHEFTVLLKTICFKLADIRNENYCSKKFIITLIYLLHLSFVISVMGLFLIGSIFVDNYLFLFVLILFTPAAIFVLRQPISLTVENHSLIFGYLFNRRTVRYGEVLNIDFEVKSNEYGNILCISINMKNSKKMTIKKIKNIALFFIMVQVKLNENRIINMNSKINFL